MSHVTICAAARFRHCAVTSELMESSVVTTCIASEGKTGRGHARRRLTWNPKPRQEYMLPLGGEGLHTTTTSPPPRRENAFPCTAPGPWARSLLFLLLQPPPPTSVRVAHPGAHIVDHVLGLERKKENAGQAAAWNAASTTSCNHWHLIGGSRWTSRHLEPCISISLLGLCTGTCVSFASKAHSIGSQAIGVQTIALWAD
ncbi:hypothetical protein QBC33DRAFT_542095 [Phialemonium atrogriseum]|uniref:Uncharacterized protein n=1 Tax=Phialemonium atrogriseum TaxID=1093897 RepID=A0AAJ0FK94_9PEZI|nr:uncharacterized protein QBC33DRAFT_542095 [Phialemonium atrogriseum]KAK1766183.1 hypothetical protein QBC33DRAFT_542095 [Phialemonium atrogriseum]